MRIESDPIPLSHRQPYCLVRRGRIDVRDGAFVIINEEDVRTHIPIGGLSCLFLEPGTRISHEAVKLAGETGCLLVWTGEGGVRCYSAGLPYGRSDNIEYQVLLAHDKTARLEIVRSMFEYRFNEQPPQNQSIEQLRGREGNRMKKLYNLLAQRYEVVWSGRQYNQQDYENMDTINQVLNSGMSCLYGVVEAAVLLAGFSPSVGFLHSGKNRSFVFDIADLFREDYVMRPSFELVGDNSAAKPTRTIRKRIGERIVQENLLNDIIDTIHTVLDTGGMDRPEPPDYSLDPIEGLE